MRQAKHSRSSSSSSRSAKPRRASAGRRSGGANAGKRGGTGASVKELAKEAWAGVEAGETAQQSGNRRSSASRSKDIH
jgi:hypothetical protein